MERGQRLQGVLAGHRLSAGGGQRADVGHPVSVAVERIGAGAAQAQIGAEVGTVDNPGEEAAGDSDGDGVDIGGAAGVGDRELEGERDAGVAAEVGGIEVGAGEHCAGKRAERGIVGVVVAAGYEAAKSPPVEGVGRPLAEGGNSGQAGVLPRPAENGVDVGVAALGAVEADAGAGAHHLVGAGVGDGPLVAAQNGDRHGVGVAHPPLVYDGEGEVDLPHAARTEPGRGERDGVGVGVHQCDGGPFEGHAFGIDLYPAVGQQIAVSVGAGAGEDDVVLVAGVPPRAVFGNLVKGCGGHGGIVVGHHEDDLVSADAVRGVGGRRGDGEGLALNGGGGGGEGGPGESAPGLAGGGGDAGARPGVRERPGLAGVAVGGGGNELYRCAGGYHVPQSGSLGIKGVGVLHSLEGVGQPEGHLRCLRLVYHVDPHRLHGLQAAGAGDDEVVVEDGASVALEVAGEDD